ncbi:molybdopterin molybdotransferase MoeA [Corynebacterium uropygiale]|uniref:Molybdopterin molybdenumtransferase n=1 Tax=Corynebacterium uropygiale TaxID=1775911 RepID=A0A9X1U0X4_9CORY|nr:molybdopterin molybdotransferase MoeA [Corynebacterium uropygiale]MCF4006948.1 molybdopterin molybdotransferase MoeA [Corynebacterium uropygiale]
MRRTAVEHYHEVLRTALEAAGARAVESCPTEEALGRVLAEECRARLPIPRFRHSAMDGVLVDAAGFQQEPPFTLPLAGDVPAGAEPQILPEGHALRIMTGAPVAESLPASVCVIPVEQTDLRPGAGPVPREVRIEGFTPGRSNIRARGEDLGEGDLVARAGTRLDAGSIAALLSAGVDSVSVRRALNVAVISSGEEISPGERGARIPDSNGPMLEALVRTLCPTAQVCRQRTRDDTAEFRAVLEECAETSDLVLTSGGISAGAYEVVREVIDPERAAHPHPVWCGRVDMQPGKPQGVGRWGRAMLLAFPGNPVACFVSAWLFLGPALAALEGEDPGREVPDDAPSAHPPQNEPFPWSHHYPLLRIPAEQDFPSPRGGLLVVPVLLDTTPDGLRARPFSPGGKGSHRVGSLVGVRGLALLRAGVQSGEDLPVLLLPR